MTVGWADVRILVRSGMVKMSSHFSLGNSLSGCILLYIEVCLCTRSSDEPSPISDSGDIEESPHQFTIWWEVERKQCRGTKRPRGTKEVG